MPCLLPAMLYHTAGDAQVPLRIRGIDNTRMGLYWSGAGAAGSQWSWKLRTRKLYKTSRKETQDFKERQLQTMTGEISSFKGWWWKHGKSCSGSLSAVLPGGGECREQSLYVIYLLHTELSWRPARPVSTKDLSVAEWEHCASAAAVRNQVCSWQLSAEALFWQGAL